MTLNDHRRRIDEVDRELVRLLNRRAQMSIEMGRVKREIGLPIRDEAREENILRQVQRSNPGPLDEHALRAIFSVILAESRRISTGILAVALSEVAE